MLALIGLPNMPAGHGQLLIIAGADLTVATVAWVLPWRRWSVWAPLSLTIPAFAVLGLSTWAFGGFAAGTGPFYVLVCAWLGLHFPLWTLWLSVPASLAAYVVPLVATRQSDMVIGSATVLVPVAAGIQVTIARRVAGLRAARERVRQVERWRAALTATLAHDLRTPLASVQLALDELSESDLTESDRDRMLTVAARQVDRINRLVSGLLDLERVDSAGTLRLDRKPVALREAAEEAATYAGRTPVDVRVPDDLVVSADPQRLEQVLVNLLSNAVRYGQPPVEVAAGRTGPTVWIAVRDHGPGIAEPARADLFTRFGGPSDHPDSVGLGLWICHELAAAHGGDLRYEPANPGARFIFTLPT